MIDEYFTSAMALDEDVYSDPHKFDPTRYLRGEPHLISQYGFGRRSVRSYAYNIFKNSIPLLKNTIFTNRICPGKHVADVSVWLAAASIISAFTISPALDKEGKPVMPELEFVLGVVW